MCGSESGSESPGGDGKRVICGLELCLRLISVSFSFFLHLGKGVQKGEQ